MRALLKQQGISPAAEMRSPRIARSRVSPASGINGAYVAVIIYHIVDQLFVQSESVLPKTKPPVSVSSPHAFSASM